MTLLCLFQRAFYQVLQLVTGQEDIAVVEAGLHLEGPTKTSWSCVKCNLAQTSATPIGLGQLENGLQVRISTDHVAVFKGIVQVKW